MNPDRFDEIQELFHAVQEASPADRAALLASADADVRSEVESLLARVSGQSPVDAPVLASLTPTLESGATVLTVGTQLGPYQVQRKLGEGGMGQVFAAVDTRLGRSVAVKVAHARFNARFEREARAIASLNHPNICTLYDVGPTYLVMELVEGETIAARLKSGPLPQEEALRYANQIAAALAEAHLSGVVHRDLKPGNIMLTRSGVKVLDFGLARLEGHETLTVERMIMGTPAYMAPEQRDAGPIDARTDIYSFGWVLYELLTGERGGRQQRQRLRSRKLEKIVSRCLEEDPARRFQSASELLQEIASTSNVKAGVNAQRTSSSARADLARKHKLVLGEFENRTSDPVFDGILRQGLSVQLAQSPHLALVPDQQIQQVLRFMSRPPDTRLTPEVAQEISARTGGTAVLEGSIASLGSRYVLWICARNHDTGDVLAQEQVQATTKEDVISALTQVAGLIRERLGESLSTIRRHSTPLETATTSSLEALKAYTAGWRVNMSQGGPAAMAHYQRAIAIDPQFAMAYAHLSIAYWNVGQTDVAAEYTRRAYELKDRVSHRESLWIEFLYDRQVTGNLPRLMQTLESWVQAYPRDWMPYSVMAGWGAMGTGQYERALQAAEEAIRLNPDDPFAYAGSIHYIFLNRFDEAVESLQRAAARKLETPEYANIRYYVAFFKDDQAGMEREIARARGQQGMEDWMWHNQALVLAHGGRMQQARSMWERAIALAEQARNHEKAAIYHAAEAVCSAHFGQTAAAVAAAQKALSLGRGRDVVYSAAYALAVSGKSSEADRLTRELASRFPEDTAVQFGYLPTLRARAALARREPLEAIERLERARPYDSALPGTAFFAKFGGLYPAYTRGIAYREAGNGSAATVEVQKVLDHQGLVFADPIGVLARLELARILAFVGDRERAKSAYGDFLTLWNEADPDIPILQQAKAELRTL